MTANGSDDPYASRWTEEEKQQVLTASRRYRALKSEGFSHEEARRIAHLEAFGIDLGDTADQ